MQQVPERALPAIRDAYCSPGRLDGEKAIPQAVWLGEARWSGWRFITRVRKFTRLGERSDRLCRAAEIEGILQPRHESKRCIRK